MMGRFFFGIAALFFFLSAVGATLVPNASAWGFVLLAVGLALGGWSPMPWKRPSA